MKNFDSITKYITYLKQHHSLNISIHISDNDNIISYGKLYLFNTHTNPYCSLLKFCDAAKCHCLEKQAAVTERASHGSFIGVCHAGVKELVYPVSNGKRTVGFISVSGYGTDAPGEYLDKISKKYSLPRCELEKAYAALEKHMPDKEKIDVLIKPLCAMLELKYIKGSLDSVNEMSFSQKVKSYITLHRREKLSSADICRHFSCSRSYLCHEFKRECGMTVGDFLLKARLEDAKYLLEYSELNVTDIAFTVGFSDANYFSSVFKRKVGIAPLEYKKTTKR